MSIEKKCNGCGEYEFVDIESNEIMTICPECGKLRPVIGIKVAVIGPSPARGICEYIQLKKWVDEQLLNLYRKKNSDVKPR